MSFCRDLCRLCNLGFPLLVARAGHEAPGGLPKAGSCRRWADGEGVTATTWLKGTKRQHSGQISSKLNKTIEIQLFRPTEVWVKYKVRKDG